MKTNILSQFKSSSYLPIISVWTLLITLFTVCACSGTYKKEPYIEPKKTSQTRVEGKVFNWPSDTLHYFSLPFYSPYSSVKGYEILSVNRSFSLSFDELTEPMILCLTPEERFVSKLRNDLLLESFTDEYYWGYCGNTYKVPITTYLIEPGTELKIDLTKTSRLGLTQIEFLNENAYSHDYYQSTFDLDQRFDELYTMSSSFDESLKEAKQLETQFIQDLNKEKSFISPFLHKYVSAEIQYASKKEFLRYLMLDSREETELLFTGDVPDEIIAFVEFDHSKVDYATLMSQEFNEFIELYVNFKNSLKNKELIIFKEFDAEKYNLANEILTGQLKYYYLANNLLHSESKNELKDAYLRFVAEYPNGDLNTALLKKYES